MDIHTFLGLVILIVLFGFIFIPIMKDKRKKRRVQQENSKRQRNNQNILDEKQITVSKSFSSFDYRRNIFYDDEKKQLLLIIDSEKTSLIHASDIIECELFEDETIVIKTSRNFHLGGAIAGGIIGGGVGAAVGGFNTGVTQTNSVRKIELRITIDNVLAPLLKFRFLDKQMPIPKYATEYKQSMNEALEWQKLITVLIHRNEKGQNDINI